MTLVRIHLADDLSLSTEVMRMPKCNGIRVLGGRGMAASIL
jgi:hypothetical protein